MKWVHCRPLTAAGLPAVLQLDQHCFGGLWSLEAYQRELISPNSDLLVLKSDHAAYRAGSDATRSAHPLIGVGCCWAIVDEAHITLLGISPQFQHQGLGQWLLLQLLLTALYRNLQRATLEVRASNVTALALYQKFGFQVAGRSPHYYDYGEDSLILWLFNLSDPKLTSTCSGWYQQGRQRLSEHGWQPKPSHQQTLPVP